jgi:hypothetical protein
MGGGLTADLACGGKRPVCVAATAALVAGIAFGCPASAFASTPASAFGSSSNPARARTSPGRLPVRRSA